MHPKCLCGPFEFILLPINPIFQISGTKGTLLITTHSSEGSSSLSTRLGEGKDWRTVPGPGMRERDTTAFSGLIHRLLQAVNGKEEICFVHVHVLPNILAPFVCLETIGERVQY